LPNIFITTGDPNGVGPEVTLKAISLLQEKVRARAILAGPFQALRDINRLLGEPVELVRVESIKEIGRKPGVSVLELEGIRECRPSFGRVAAEAGLIAGRGITAGVAACLKGEADALVTAPVSKEALHKAGYHFPGQTEMIASLAAVSHYIMILAAHKLRVGMVTTHQPLRQVADLVTQETVLEKIIALYDALRTWFGVQEPRLAVAALNPHASDGGIFGDEEARVIIPALEEARLQRITVAGPLPADTLFPRWKEYDGVLAMYHDQGMIPIKMAAFGQAVNFTGGLPFPRTSPDHGTAFDIAGKLKADPRSMMQAIETAYEFALRARYQAAQKEA
jgi:4-phospho-D-threonate 3-dehydrogenase / 4-phospho-D-erythronate 3-dehydrogenase